MHIHTFDSRNGNFVDGIKVANGYTHQIPLVSFQEPHAFMTVIFPRSLLSRNTHPQLPLPLLRLQNQPLNRVTQPLLLPPQLLQPQRLPAPIPVHTHTASLPRGAAASRAPHGCASFAYPAFEQFAPRYEGLFAAGEFVEVRFDFGEERGDFGGQGGEEGGLGGLEGGFGEEFEMLG